MKKTPKSKKPSRIEMNEKELQSLIEEIKSSRLSKTTIETVVNILLSYRWLNEQLDRGRLTIKKLRRLFFGPNSEKKKKIFGKGGSQKNDSNSRGEDSSGPSDLLEDGTASSPKGSCGDASEEKSPQKSGHGKTSHKDYNLKRVIDLPHEKFSAGDICPSCERSRLYRYGYGSVLRLVGQPPVAAELWRPEQLRCSGCGELFTASLPPEAGHSRVHPTANAMVALLNYGNGIPFYRLQGLQSQLKVPLADSTQFDMAEEVANAGAPVVGALKKLASNGDLIGHDDTKCRILSLMKENELKANPKGRTGIQTTGIVAKVDGRTINLFVSGRGHAGENLDELLHMREKGLGPPMQVCDALSANFTTDFWTIIVKCLDHGRRGFADVASSFPKECHFVIDQLAQVYAHDAVTKKLLLDTEERLAYHKEHSGPIMNRLNSWMEEQFENRNVEPNSKLGEAINYFLKHWNGLTEFLRTPGAPLPNAECEQLLKRCVLRRKNSMHYKTEMGALIGDILMSLIQTATQSGVNVFKYLVALQHHSSAVRKDPESWLPWNYQAALPLT